MSLRTHQGFPTQERDATLDSMASALLHITVHCCVEFQKSSGCTFQKRVTYLERKEYDQAIKYNHKAIATHKQIKNGTNSSESL